MAKREPKIGAAPKEPSWLDQLKQVLGPNQMRPTPWTPPDLALDPIRALIQRLVGSEAPQMPMQREPAIGAPGRTPMLGGPNAAIGAPGQGRMLGGPQAAIGAPGQGRMLGGADARIGAPPPQMPSMTEPPMMASHTAAAMLPKAARAQLQGAANPRGVQQKASRAVLQTAGVPMPEFDQAVSDLGQVGPVDFGQSDMLAQLAAAGGPQPLESTSLGVDALAASPESMNMPPADKKRNAIIRALMLGLGR